MKFKIKCIECFQEVETVIEVNSYKELTEAIKQIRLSIRIACNDVLKK